TAKHALEGLLRALPIQQRSTGVVIVRPPRLRTSLTHMPVTGDVLPPEDVAVTLVRTLLDGSTGPESVTILETFEVNGSMSTPVTPTVVQKGNAARYRWPPPSPVSRWCPPSRGGWNGSTSVSQWSSAPTPKSSRSCLTRTVRWRAIPTESTSFW